MTANLITRLEAATEPSAALNREIARALGAEVLDRHGRIGGGAYRNVPWIKYDTSRWQVIPNWSGSIDDALTLVEAKLPGWSCLMAITPAKTVCDIHSRPVGDFAGVWPGHAEANTAPLAILRAFLSALASQEQQP